MATLARLDVLLGLEAKAFVKGISTAQKRLKRFGAQAERSGRAMTTALTLPIAAVGGAAIKASVDFDTSMRKIAALVGASDEEIAAYTESILGMAGALGTAPAELAEGLFFITSAGQKGAQALGTLTAGAKAAAAGLGTTAVVVDAATSAVNAYGASNLSSAKATAILVAAVREGKASAETLAPVFGDLLDSATLLNIGFDQLGAGLAHITRTGKTASGAATQIGAIMLGLVKPTAQAYEQFEKTETSIDEIRKTIREKGLLTGLIKLRDAFGEDTEALGKVFRNAEAFNGILNLTRNNGVDAAKIFAALARTVENDLDVAFNKSAEGPGFAFKQVLAEIGVAAIRLGNALLPTVIPIVQQLGKIVGEAAEAFAKLPEGIRTSIIVFALVVAAAGPVLLIIGAIASGLAIVGSTTAIWAAGAVVAAAVISASWEKIKTAVKATIDYMRPAIDEITRFILAQWQSVKETAQRLWPRVQVVVGRAVAAMVKFWEAHGAKIVFAVKVAWKLVSGLIETGVELALGLIEGFVALTTRDFAELKTVVVRTIGAMMGGASKTIAAAVAGMAAHWADLAVAVLTSIQTQLGKMADYARAIEAIAFFSPALKAAARLGLGVIEAGYSKIGTKIIETTAEAAKWREAQALILKPIEAATAGLVQYQSEWYTAQGVMENVAINTEAIFGQATDKMVATVTGGFGKAADSMKAQYRDVAVTIEGTKIVGTVTIKVDDADFNRWLEERGMEPAIGGVVP